MVNAGVVNARPPCLARAEFCVFFRVLGRFLRFKKPVKYICSSQINHDTVHFAARRASANGKMPRIINNIAAA
jgi:hypothetical protein